MVHAKITATKLRIGVVTTYPPSRGTLNEYGFHLIEALRADPRVESVHIMADELEGVRDAPASPGISLERCWGFGKWNNAINIARAVRRARVDAVLVNAHFRSFAEGSVPSALSLLSAPMMSLLGTPTTLILHNIVEAVDLVSTNMVKSKFAARLASAAGTALTWLLLRSDRVSVLLPSYHRILLSKYRAKNAVHIPHGVFGPPAASPYPHSSDPTPRILTFGKFGTYKRVEILLEAAQLLQERGHRSVEIVIAGTDSPNTPGYLESVKQRFAQFQNVKFTGYLEEADVEPTLATATVVVLPYTSTTGSSGVLHQIGRVGRAVAMPQIGDLSELVQIEGYRGETFEPGSASSLADALERLITNPERRREIERANFAAAQACSMDKVAARYVDEIVTISKPQANLSLSPAR